MSLGMRYEYGRVDKDVQVPEQELVEKKLEDLQ